MSRSRNKGPVAGNYVPLRLVARIAVASGQTAVVVDRIPLPQNFRVTHVCFDAKGTTAAVNAFITNNAGTLITASTVVSSGTPKAILPAALVAGTRNVPKGDSLDLRITTDGTGVVAAGQVVAIVTGYFTEHITNGRFAESGQSKLSGPVTGRYAILTLNNTAQVANAAEAANGALIAPFDCRVMAIAYSIVGHTETTGAITGRIKNATSGNFLHSAIDIDTLTSDIGRIDALTGAALVNRDVSRGDTLELHVAAGVADVVPIFSLTATMVVWVRGHVDFSGVTDGLDHLSFPASGASRGGQDTGPVEGGIIVYPFINKRAANATARVEDLTFIPLGCRVYAVSTSKAAATSTTRHILNGGTTWMQALTTQNYILHNEGNAFPAPGSWAGGILGGSQAGDVVAQRAFPFGNVMQFSLAVAGDAALADTMHVFAASDGHVYTDPAND